MRQRKYPCCGEPINETDLLILVNSGGSSCPTITCEHCGKELTVYLNIDSVEVLD